LWSIWPQILDCCRHRAAIRAQELVQAPVALLVAEDLPDPYTTSDVALQLARAYLESGRFAQGWPIVERALSLAEQAGALAHAALVRHKRASFEFGLGQWDRARRDWEEAAAVAQRLGAEWLLAGTLWCLAHLHLSTGDEQAERAIEEACSIGAKTRPAAVRVSLAFARAEEDLLAGRALEARERLLSPDAPIDYEVYWCDPQSGCLPPLAWMYAEIGAEDEAEEITQRILSRPVEESSLLLRVGALHVQAKLARKRAAWSEARRALDEALHLCTQMPYPYGKSRYSSNMASCLWPVTIRQRRGSDLGRR
jgi:tetratricopeptide (TPR) repeat protein